MNIAIQGATGALGCQLMAEFGRRGFTVFGITRNCHESRGLCREVNWFDYSFSPLGREQDFDFETLDVLINVATSYGRQGESDQEMIDANISRPQALLNHAIGLKSLKTYIYAGTILPPNYNTYARTKHQFATLARRVCERRNVQFINLVTDIIYGPGIDTNFLNAFIKDCLANKASIELTSGRQVRSPIFIDDVINAYEFLVCRKGKLKLFETIDLRGSQFLSVRRLTEYIREVAESDSQLIFGAKDEPPLWMGEMRVPNVKRMSDFGWTQKISLEEGLIRTISALRT